MFLTLKCKVRFSFHCGVVTHEVEESGLIVFRIWQMLIVSSVFHQQ